MPLLSHCSFNNIRDIFRSSIASPRSIFGCCSSSINVARNANGDRASHVLKAGKFRKFWEWKPSLEDSKMGSLQKPLELI